MLETVFVFGAIILLGLVLILLKLPAQVSLWLLGHHTLLDIAVTGITLWIHWGTMTGLMSAAMAGLMCSLLTSGGRRLFGYIKHGRYFRGLLNLQHLAMR